MADSADQRDRLNDFAPDTVLYTEGLSRGSGGSSVARWIALTKPVNIEELRRALRQE
ncbi:MAG: hypothetical protein JSV86_04125 [Gemmatimonadota bacterium]|nr:MAG: hypothetical protein JSV86_04125 [Gemmatimonadota bacterium]